MKGSANERERAMTASIKLYGEVQFHHRTESRPSAVDVFRERCQARAILVEACLMDLQEAVDGLQADADRNGLVDNIGQDAVQRMMADVFGVVPRVAHVRKPLAPVVIESKPVEISRSGTAASTLAAAKYLIKQNDPARFKAWFVKHTHAERIAISKHLRGAKS